MKSTRPDRGDGGHGGLPAAAGAEQQMSGRGRTGNPPVPVPASGPAVPGGAARPRAAGPESRGDRRRGPDRGGRARAAASAADRPAGPRLRGADRRHRPGRPQPGRRAAAGRRAARSRAARPGRDQRHPAAAQLVRGAGHRAVRADRRAGQDRRPGRGRRRLRHQAVRHGRAAGPAAGGAAPRGQRPAGTVVTIGRCEIDLAARTVTRRAGRRGAGAAGGRCT